VIKNINVPILQEEIDDLKAGDYITITGIIYTARDAAHQRMQETLKKSLELPFELTNNIIYYMGPSPARDGNPIGSAGPTTSSRMDKFTPQLFRLGLKGVIGKGKRSEEVKQSIVDNKGIYLVAVGGVGALLSKSIIKSELIAYEDLGTEAIYKLEVKNFPVFVGIDSFGNDYYEKAILEYKQKQK